MAKCEATGGMKKWCEEKVLNEGYVRGQVFNIENNLRLVYVTV
jgi:hypothetical protein